MTTPNQTPFDRQHAVAEQLAERVMALQDQRDKDREMIECLLSALEYHEEQTRPIHSTTTAIQAAREHLRSMK